MCNVFALSSRSLEFWRKPKRGCKRKYCAELLQKFGPLRIPDSPGTKIQNVQIAYLIPESVAFISSNEITVRDFLSPLYFLYYDQCTMEISKSMNTTGHTARTNSGREGINARSTLDLTVSVFWSLGRTELGNNGRNTNCLPRWELQSALPSG